MTDTATRINQILVEHLGVEPSAVVPEALIVPEHDDRGMVSGIKPSLGADSLDVVELVMACEEEFIIEITDDESDKLNSGTVGDLHAMIAAKLAERAAA